MEDVEKRGTEHRDVVTPDAVSEKNSAAYGSDGEAGLTFKEERSRREKKLVLKLDMVILPLTALLYLSAYLVSGFWNSVACRTDASFP